MPILGTARTYHPKFKFYIRIDGIQYASFQSCTELASEFAEIDQWEGGTLIPYKTPGRITYDDVTLARGVTGNTELYEWHRSIGVAASGQGLVPEHQFKRNVEIVQQDRLGSILRTWVLWGAWPKRYVAGDWDNEADENVIEQIVLAFDYYELRGGGIVGAVRGVLGV
jgi:phage tail-like protein